MQYYLKLKSNPDNPTYKAVFEPKHRRDFSKKPSAIPPFSLRCEADINSLDFVLEDVAEQIIPEVFRN